MSDALATAAKQACTVFLTAAEGHHPEPCRACQRIADAIKKAYVLGLGGRGLDGKLLPAPPFTANDGPQQKGLVER